MKDPLLNLTTYQYDTLGQLTQVTDADSHYTTYNYDGAGNLTSVIDALQHGTYYEYDARNRLTTITDAATAQPPMPTTPPATLPR